MKISALVKIRIDSVLLTAVVILIITGTVMIFSTSAIFSLDRYKTPYFFIKRQLFWLLAGSAALLIFKNIKYEAMRKFAVPAFIASICALLLVFLPHIGRSVNGAKRWINIGFSNFEPSELVKLFFIVFMAASISRKADDMKNFKKGVLPYLLIIGFVSVILLKQPDMGSAVVIGAIGLIMLFIGGAKIGYLVMLIISAAPAVYMLIMRAGYRQKRMMAFLDPWKDPLHTGFQIVQSFIAFGSGGIAGKGLGKGTQKLFYLPEAHTDFIFAIIGEELGLIGATAILILFMVIIWRGMKIALNTRDDFGRLLAVGLTSYIGLQAFINMSVVLGLMPTKGMTLPFVSYGGSSLLINMAAVGMLMNLSSRAKEDV